MKTMIILLALIVIFGPSIAGAQSRGVAVRSGFVARPGFSRGAFFPRPFVAVRPGFPHRGIFPGAFIPYAYPYSYPFRYSYAPYPYPYSYSLYSYTGYPNHPGYLTPDQINSARSYSVSLPPPPANAYDRGYTPKGTLRDMSKPRRNTIRIATKKESSAVSRKVTKRAKAERTLRIVFVKRFSRKPLRALSLVLTLLGPGRAKSNTKKLAPLSVSCLPEIAAVRP
jgi:hypothetical protein